MRWIAFALVLFAASPARAQEPSHESSWYGYQILALDVPVGVLSTKAPELIFAMPLTGPIVHLANGSPGRALGSLVLRAGLPVLGLYLGAAAAHCGTNNDEELCGLGEALAGGLLGFAIAEIVDVGVLAWKDGADDERPVQRARRKTIDLAPSLGTTPQGGFGLGVVGRF